MYIMVETKEYISEEMLKNIFKKTAYYVSSDLRNAKLMDVDNNIVHMFDLKIHNYIFFLFLPLSIIFYGDIWFLDSHFSTSIIQLISLEPLLVTYVENEPLKLLYFLFSALSITLSFPLALYFYIKYGGEVLRRNFMSTTVINTFITNIIGYCTLPMGVFIFFIGGYLGIIHIPSRLYLDSIPGFIIIQIFFLLKVQALLTLSACRIFQVLLPYSLHSKIFSYKTADKQE